MISKNGHTIQVQPKNRLFLQLLLWHFLIISLAIFCFTTQAHASLNCSSEPAPVPADCIDTPTAWSDFTSSDGYTASYTHLGQPISDHTESQDPSNGGTGVGTDAIDLASGSPNNNPGPYDTPAYGYYDGGTSYDPTDPTTLEDDFILFRMRLLADPSSNKDDFSSYHWNILVDVDDDGYKEYWVDVNGGAYQNEDYDQLQVLYNNDNNQEVTDPDADRVNEFLAYNTETIDSNPSNSFTRVVATTDGTSDYFLEVQVPMTAFNDGNGNQALFPDSPVGFVFSTSNSGTDPLQKDWMMDLDFISDTDPITFGDVVIINGEPMIEFIDSDLEKVSFYEEGNDVYTYVKHPIANEDDLVLETITITVTNPTTDDDEELTLCESSPNSGLFTNKGGAEITSVDDPDNGWISYVTTSSTTDAADWDIVFDNASGEWLVYKNGSGTPQTNTIDVTEPEGYEYTSDNGEITFTIYEISPTNGDTIEISTCAADPLPWETDDGTPHNKNDNGYLEFSGGNTIQFSYTYEDPEDATQNKTLTTSTPIVGTGAPFMEFTRATGLPNTDFELKQNVNDSDKLYVTVTHDPTLYTTGVVDTIDVHLEGTDDEWIELTETGPDTGIFRNTTGLDTQILDAASPYIADRWEDVDSAEVTATYSFDPGTGAIDYFTTANLFYVDGAGRVFFTSSAGTEDVELYTDNQRVYIKVDDPDLAGTGTVDVVLTCPVGDSMTVSLTETATGSGVFINNASGDPAITTETFDGTIPIDTSDDILMVNHDTTITVTYTDADDGDIDATNNGKTDTATYFDPPIVINEVFFYPTPEAAGTYDGQTEYFQIYNSSSSNVDIYGYTITDGDGFTYTFPEDPGGGTPGQFILEPGEYAYVFLYSTFNNDPATYDTQIGDTFYLFTDVADTTLPNAPSDQFGDPDDTSPDRSDQLTLKDDSGIAQDYVAWSYETTQSIDFLSDDSSAVSQGIWDENDYRDVLSTPIAQGSSIKRSSDGFDTDDPSDWVYSSTSSLWDPDASLLTPVGISSFEAFNEQGRVMLRWETSYENGAVGFYIFRKTDRQYMYQLVNKKLVPALIGNSQGGTYQYYDKTAIPGETYSYLLEEVVETGERIEYGPFTVKADNSSQKEISSVELIRIIRQVPAFARKRQDMRRDFKTRLNRFNRNPFTDQNYFEAKTLKISTSEPGLYHINARDIAQYSGLQYRTVVMLLNSYGFELSNQGMSIPYFIERRNPGIYFYGFEHSDIYTEKNVFWLSLGRGKRMRYLNLRKPREINKNQSFNDSIPFEENIIPITSQSWESTDDYWIWNYSFSGFPGLDLMSFPFQLNGVVPTEDNASITLHLVGGSIDGDVGIGDHLAEVSLNGTSIGECTWKGIDLNSCTILFSQKLLQDGENLLEVHGKLIHGGGFSLFYVDSFDIDYRRSYKSVDNAIVFPGNGDATLSISGFDSQKIYLLDISNRYNPRLALRTQVNRESNTYRLNFSPKSTKSKFMAVASPAVKSVDGIISYNSSGLKKRNNWADYLIITPSELKESVQELAEYRTDQGHVVKIAELDQIVNEFNDGLYSPMAIKQFLAYAHSEWYRAPQFVILIGDANYDYRDLQGFGGNLIPTIFVSSPNGLFASDNYLADVDDDGIPEMAIGRLPVLSGEELEHIVTKIKVYESSYGEWKDKILLLADESDGEIKFAWDSERLSHLIPLEYSLEKIYLTNSPLDAARQKLFDKLHEGAAFANYFGHGGTDRIASHGLLLSDDVEFLSSAGRAPVITAMTCAVGEFTFPSFDTLAELLILQPNGGATAVWSASGLSINAEARHLDREFYKAIYSGNHDILGKAILKSFREYSYTGDEPYHLLIYNLLGDPALKIR